MKLAPTLRSFCKRNKALAIAFACSIILLVRHSDIPYPFEPPFLIEVLFTAPANQFQRSLGAFLDAFASAYATSLIFYYLVDFAPKEAKERNALCALKDMVGTLISYSNDLISLLLYLGPKDTQNDIEKTDASLNEIAFKNEVLYCRTSNQAIREQSGSDMTSLIPYSNARVTLENIKLSLRQITESPMFSDAPWKLVGAITAVLQSDLINSMHFDFSANQIPSQGISFVFKPNSLSAFVESIEALSAFSDKAEARDVYTDASKEEIDKFVKSLDGTLASFISEYPEAMSAMRSFSKNEGPNNRNHKQGGNDLD